ncbi:uracil-DNA glycosylase [Aeromonas hydrophila]|uniref:uracil-DNA glycosylase n=1 Tax=Aeromonas hydrophila TaxID=644 RepID=UPI00249EE1A4|nr:uracil-DNA glycosylase [Aeromonas hydrophila]WGY31619.1 uracil-DNA glycosylase [Aeromonas hydrophila]HDC4323848.1 uracil-DNA glycosylase [Aeromonas hydrophila]HDC4325360.1 uracil-DNA glycosylase [Aeromonas hydrophila]
MDIAKMLADDAAIKARMAQLEEPHIRALTQFVRDLRENMGAEAAIPYFDPWDAGVQAEVLFLLEAPGPKAKNSGFISMNNPDETAKNIFEITHAIDLDRRRILLWNTVPWYIGSGQRIRAANTKDIRQGIDSLAQLLALLPCLQAVVLVGKKAQKVEKHIRAVAPQLNIFTSPHPSPMFVNRKPENRSLLLNDWQHVQKSLAQRC